MSYCVQTLLMDEHRFVELRDKVTRLTLVASVVIITYSTVGGSISGLAELKTKLTSQIIVLTKDSSRR
jgi:T-complex protein 11